MSHVEIHAPEKGTTVELHAETAQKGVTSIQWLTLKDACDFLGVHYTTLRSWADKGEIAVFRTPGGHRRFSLADLRRFLDERASHANPTNALVLIDQAIDRTRQVMQEQHAELTGWHYNLASEERETRRTRGRKLFALAVAYVMKQNQRERILQEAVELGREYGVEAAMSGINLAQAGRAVQFFRNQLIQAFTSQDASGHQDIDDVRIRALVDQFLDEVLYAVLDGFESVHER